MRHKVSVIEWLLSLCIALPSRQDQSKHPWPEARFLVRERDVQLLLLGSFLLLHSARRIVSSCYFSDTLINIVNTVYIKGSNRSGQVRMSRHPVVMSCFTYPHELRSGSLLLHWHRATVRNILQAIVCSVIQRLSDVILPGVTGYLGVHLRQLTSF